METARNDRRRLHARLAQLIDDNGRLNAAVDQQGSFQRRLLAATPSNVVYVSPPSGNADQDTGAVLTALEGAAPGTIIILTTNGSNVYSINQELPIPEGVRVTGSGPTGEEPQTALIPTLQQAAGTALTCIMANAGFLTGKTAADAGIEVDHLAFDGQGANTSGGNTAGHGVVLMSNGSKVHDCYFLNVAQAAVVVADANSDSTPVTGPLKVQENSIDDNTIVGCGWYGIWVWATPGSSGATDGYMRNNVVRSPSQQVAKGNSTFEAMRLDNSAGWWVERNHLSECPGGGFYGNTNWGLHLIGNMVADFGCEAHPGQTYVGYKIYCSGWIKCHPGFVNGNYASAYEGLNPLGSRAPSATTNYLYFQFLMSDNIGSAWFEHANNAVHQDSVPPGPIKGATIDGTTVTVPSGAAAGVQAGMTIIDKQGVIAPNTTVSSVSGNTIELSKSAASTGANNDELKFRGPVSVAWTYVNDNPSSTMNVQRFNETITGSISSKPSVVGTANSVILTDPARWAGGVAVTNSPPLAAGPAPGYVIAATSATEAAWSIYPGPAAGGMLGGSFPSPGFTPQRLITFTNSGTYEVPGGAQRLRITCVGGGGGGGGGSAGRPGDQVGGGGGSAGTTVEQIVDVSAGMLLNVHVGPPGGGGKSSATASDAGAGGATAVIGRNIEIRAPGGDGGRGAASGTGEAVSGARHGLGAGSGGSSGSPGGFPFTYSPGGGGGGGAAGMARGGIGGGAGSRASGGSAGAGGGAASLVGETGQSATDPGGGGGGGGGGSGITAGGAGGDGAGGYVVVEIVG
jgi:hypothetical protein